MELMNLLEIANTGKLNYHLKVLGNLIEKGDDGKYRLTERGRLAFQLVQKFPERTIETKPLGMGDALLIGIAGFVLLFAFPLIILPVVGFLFAFSGFLVAAFLVTVYEVFVPGGLMWLLTVRRTRSHDFYDLLKPPIVPMALMIAWLALMMLLRESFSIAISFYSENYAQISMMGFSSFLIMGGFPVVGVVIAESVYRLSKRL